MLSQEFSVRHPALQRQGSPVSLTDIFCNLSVSVSVCLGFRFRLLLVGHFQSDTLLYAGKILFVFQLCVYGSFIPRLFFQIKISQQSLLFI